MCAPVPLIMGRVTKDVSAKGYIQIIASVPLSESRVTNEKSADETAFYA